MDTLIPPQDSKIAEIFATRDLKFYNEQVGKDYNQVFEALSGHIPLMRYQARQKIAGQIYQSHKKGKEFKTAHRIMESDGTSQFQIFTVSFSPDAPTYVNWDSVNIAIRKLMLAEMEGIEKAN